MASRPLLYLIRHGQASFGARDYDALSPTGERQAALLGEHWRRLRLRFDAVYSGRMRRQQDSARRVLEAAGENPAALRIEAAFDEFDHRNLIRAYLPLVAREHPELALDPRELFGDARKFQALFEHIVAAWASDRPGAEPLVERWTDFCARSLDGLARAAASGERIAVFTSGGVITAVLRAALGLSDRAAFRLNWRILNASVHLFRLEAAQPELRRFNDVAHLELHQDPSLLTYR
ncbi:MAG: histidine phosphatase family protein [Sinobacteraceae bacterium]|nr:histidine phosphatase family protein [Nevskiaceae bacterium]